MNIISLIGGKRIMTNIGEARVQQFPNCWEYKKCGRESGGTMTYKAGVCPASTEKQLNAVHGGKNGGRACWVIKSTSAKDDIMGVDSKKSESCMSCNFYQLVKAAEGKHLWPISFMQKLIKWGNNLTD
jgi:hypothetical protein